MKIFGKFYSDGVRRKLERYEKLSRIIKSYSDELVNQTDRAGILDWFQTQLSENHSCILCGKPSDYSSKESQWLHKMVASIKNESRKIDKEPVRLENDTDGIRKEIDQKEDSLHAIKKELAELESQSNDAAAARLSFQRINQFIGRMQQAIAHIDYSDDSSEIQQKLKKLEKQKKAISDQIAKYKLKERQSESFAVIGNETQKHAAHLDLEKHNSTLSFDTKELMLGFYNSASPGDKEKPDYLYEIGSGENWMGYHVAFFLALHQQFINVPKSPVFSFLVIDQPTQVYFPAVESFSAYDDRKKSVASKQQDTPQNEAPTTVSQNPAEQVLDDTMSSEDVSAGATDFDIDTKKAKRIFEVLSMSLKSTQEQYQIIVTEHADEDVWGGVELIHKVADWRGNGNDSYLVPLEWIDNGSSVGTPVDTEQLPETQNILTEDVHNSNYKTLFDNCGEE